MKLAQVRGVSVALAVLLTLGLWGLASSRCGAEPLPDYMDIIVGNDAPESKAQSAENNILGLDTAMMGIYSDALMRFQKHFLAQHPVILALFSIGGGQLTLYRPDHPPLQAPPVPVLYQLVKSVSHASMAIFELAGSHLGNVSDGSWRGPMISYKAANQAALAGLDALDVSNDIRDTLRKNLEGNIAFMNACLTKGTYTFADLQQFTQKVKPYLVKNIWVGADTQVAHWMKVVKDWKELIGPDWNKTYALSNTLYVTRQNNIIFSVLAQFFGKEAINTRLFLFETSAFTSTPDQMFDVLIRTVADRSVGQVFFGNYYLMDYELMGGDARKAIEVEDKKLGMEVFLPPAVPFHSNAWPWKIDPSTGEGPTRIEEIK
jgi:hypothetical protein